MMITHKDVAESQGECWEKDTKGQQADGTVVFGVRALVTLGGSYWKQARGASRGFLLPLGARDTAVCVWYVQVSVYEEVQ